MPSKQAQLLAGVGLLLAVLYGAVAFYLATSQDNLALWGMGAFAALAAALSGVSLLHAMLRYQAALEAREQEELADRASLFSNEEQTHIRQRNLQQFEQFFAPGLALAAGLAEFLLGVRLLQLLGAASESPTGDTALVALAVSAVAGIACYLFGSFCAGLAFRGEQSALRAVSSEFVGLGLLSALAALSALLVRAELPLWNRWLAGLFALLLLVRALEKALAAVLEFYRPRRGGGAEQLVYESRLNGLLAQPEGILHNLSETLDYQFGVRISEAAFRRFLVVLLPAIVVFQLLVFLLFSCLVIVRPGEQAVRERFGQPVAGAALLGPGVHLKLPWPVASVHRYPVATLQHLRVSGFASEDEAARGLWRVAGGDVEADHFLVPGPPETPGSHAFVVPTVTVRYRIADPVVWHYRHSAPHALLRRLARRELSRYLRRRPLPAVLRLNRVAAGRTLSERLQTAADAVGSEGLGVAVEAVQMRQLQPAPDVVEDFHKHNAAVQQRLATVTQARIEADATLSGARQQRAMALARARAEVARLTALYGAEDDTESAEEAYFAAIREVYRSYPRQFVLRAYLSRLEQALRGEDKVVLATEAEVPTLDIDLKHKMGSSLLSTMPE